MMYTILFTGKQKPYFLSNFLNFQIMFLKLSEANFTSYMS